MDPPGDCCAAGSLPHPASLGGFYEVPGTHPGSRARKEEDEAAAAGIDFGARIQVGQVNSTQGEEDRRWGPMECTKLRYKFSGGAERARKCHKIEK